MSYLTQMLGLTVQNFVSAAAGMAVLVALIRGFARRSARDDRQLLGRPDAEHALHPAAAVASSWRWSSSRRAWCRRSARTQARVSDPYDEPSRRRQAGAGRQGSRDEKSTLTEQVIAVGPAASQIAIKQLGTNGGGFFNVNSAHPFENPTPLSNFLEMLAILLIPAALCYTFGDMVGDTPPGLGGAGGHDGDLRRRCSWLRRRRAERQSRSPSWASTTRPARCSRAATWKARRCASASPTRRCGRRRRPRPRTARSTRCTTRSRRSAGWCRCG